MASNHWKACAVPPTSVFGGFIEEMRASPARRLVFTPKDVHNFKMWDFKGKSFLHGLRDHKDTVPTPRKGCDVPGCPHTGEYKAPKSRYDLRDYFWFCLDHVREYNANWDFFKGMSPGEIEHHMHRTAIWDRPTWRMTEAGNTEERTREKIYTHFARGESVFGDFSMGGEGEEPTRERDAHIDIGSIPHPTVEALGVLGLAPPVGWEEVKSRYKSLAKKYHPDTNKDKNAEEQFKKVNMAYTILKLSYQTYSQLDER